MSRILGISLTWNVVVNYLAKVDSKGRINYTDFISRYSIPIHEDLSNEVVSSITDKIFESCLDLAKAFDTYDVNHDGKISLDEFIESLRKYNLGFSEEQLYDFMASLDSDHDGTIDFNEFKQRFAVELEMKTRGDGSGNEWLKKTIEEVSIKIKKSGRALSQVFRSYDKDKNNKMSYQEFSYMMNREFGGEKLTEDELKTMFEKIDSNNSSYISYAEFKESFQIVDSKSDAWQQQVIQKICDCIRKSKTQLKTYFLSLDSDKSGKVDINEFKVGLESMNILLEQPLTDDQITIIYTHIDKDLDGFIDFNEFLNAFSVVQTNSEGLKQIN